MKSSNVMANDNAKTMKESTIDNSQSLVDIDEDTDISQKCGLFGYRPAFLQKAKSVIWFSVLTFIIFVIKDSSTLYLITIQENIRRLLSLSSFEFQLISGVSNLGALVVFFLFPLRHYVPKKTIWIAVAMNVAAIGLFIAALPGLGVTSVKERQYYLMVFGYFVHGIGSISSQFLILSYIDDSVNEKQAVRLVGVCGFVGIITAQIFGGLMGYYVTKKSKVSQERSLDDLDEPWWIGFLVISVCLILLSFVVIFFPSSLREKDDDAEKELTQSIKLRILYSNYVDHLKLLFESKMFIYAVCSFILTVAAVLAIRANLNIFVVHMFGQKIPFIAPIFLFSIILTALAVLVFSLIISSYEIELRKLTLWNIVVLASTLICVFILYSMPCDHYVHIDPQHCQNTCNDSPQSESKVVCSIDNRTMFKDACHAGCTNESFNEGSFNDCSCAETITGFSSVKQGKCPLNDKCRRIKYFFVTMVILFPALMSTATFGVSKYMTIVRCVKKKHNDLAMMVTQVTSALLAMFPAPLLFGHILDKSCVYEGDGDCELYNLQTMGRDFYMGMMILIVAVIGFEFLIYRNSKDFDLYGTKKNMK